MKTRKRRFSGMNVNFVLLEIKVVPI